MFKQTSLHCVHNYGTFKSSGTLLLKIAILIITQNCSKRTAFDLIDS